jgi:cobalt-zinc-cadmium efflux system outer membrane protein
MRSPSFFEGGSFYPLFLRRPSFFWLRHSAQQQPSMPGMQIPHGQEQAQQRAPEFPRLGRATIERQRASCSHSIAHSKPRGKRNPTLRQAEAGIRAAHARAQQAGFYPNPTVGYAGDEIRGGESHGGKQGFFVEQAIVTGGKVSRVRDVFAKEARLAEIEAEEQKIRVETAVKMAFYRVLAAQELADARGDLARIANENLETERKLQNTGQADESEILASELEARRMKLSAHTMENTLREEWRALASVLGQPDLPLQSVAGDLEHGWPELDEHQVETVSTQSPANRIAATASERAQAALARARREKIPDVLARAGLDYNHEPLDNPQLTTGWQWNAQLAVELPLFNRNQGKHRRSARRYRPLRGRKTARRAHAARTRFFRFRRICQCAATAEEYRDNILHSLKSPTT